MSRSYLDACILSRVGNFQQNNYSTEDGIDRTIGLFLRNSVCSVEHKTLGIPFQTVPQWRKMLRKLDHGKKNRSKLSEFHSEPFHGTDNSRNSVSNHSEEKNAQKSVPWIKNISKFSEFRSEACLEQKHAVYLVCWHNFLKN